MTPEPFLASEREQEAARSLRDVVFYLIDHHEAAEHTPIGGPCWEQRAGIVAYVAHALGFTSADALLIGEALAVYDEAHDQAHGAGAE